MRRGNRPSITRLGHVVHRGDQVLIGGWELGLCAARCDCHRHPTGGHLTTLEDAAVGSLGLVSHRAGCTCCQPWTWAELEAVIRDALDLAALAHT